MIAMERRISWRRTVSFLVCSLALVTVDAQSSTPSTDIRLPPSMTLTPNKNIVFNPNAPVILQCGAVGTPTPTYSWIKNGAALSMSQGNIQNQGQGNIIIQPATITDQGYYQCFAANQWGTALTNVSFVQCATLSAFPPNSQTAGYVARQGNSLQLTCSAPASVPNATYSWATAPSTTSQIQTPVPLSARVMVDLSGNLCFANVIPSDATNGTIIYKCNVYNSFLSNTVGGSYSTISVTLGNPINTGPSIAGITNSPSVALIGQTISLFCFFNGYPTPTITWISTLPSGRYTFSNFNTTVTITGIIQSDQMTYTCQGASTSGTITASISLYVFDAPQFVSVANEPININATNGQTVSFVCNALSNPTPQTVWYQNAQNLNPSSLPSGYSLSADLTVLTVNNVCKECTNGASNLAVIQCNMTNIYGYVFGQGYLNVLVPTTITTQPTNQYLTTGGPITFNCQATSDPSTSVSYTWMFNNQLITYNNSIYSQSGGNLIINAGKAPNGGTGLEGMYTCEASNGFSGMNVTADLLPPVAGPVIVQSAASLWWVFLLIALLLILLLLVLCWWCHRHNEGDSYPVDKQEKKNGNDPVQEIKNNDFKDFQRPDQTAVNAPPTQLQSANPRASWTSIKFSNEDATSVDYSNFDGGKFNEEGSFIGQYVPKKLKLTGMAAPRLACPEEDEGRSNADYPAAGQDGGYSTMNGNIDEIDNTSGPKQYPYKPSNHNNGEVQDGYVGLEPPRVLNQSMSYAAQADGAVFDEQPVFAIDSLGQFDEDLAVNNYPDDGQYNAWRSQSPGGKSDHNRPMSALRLDDPSPTSNRGQEVPIRPGTRGHTGLPVARASANVSYDSDARFADGVVSNISVQGYAGVDAQYGGGYQQDGDTRNGLVYFEQDHQNGAQIHISDESAV